MSRRNRLLAAGLVILCGSSAACDRAMPALPANRHVSAGNAVRGRDLLAGGTHGCAACHDIPGIQHPRGIVGPPLAGFAQRSFIAGELPNNPEVLVEFLQNPPMLVSRTGMPDTRLSLTEARDIAAYLYTLEPSHVP